MILAERGGERLAHPDRPVPPGGAGPKIAFSGTAGSAGSAPVLGTDFVDRKHWALAALMANRQVDGDAVEPGVKGAGPLEGRKLGKGLGEGLLHHIASILGRAHHVRNGMVKPILIAAHQFAKGRRFAVQGRCDELGVFHGQSAVFHRALWIRRVGARKSSQSFARGTFAVFLAGARLPPGQLTRAAEIVKLLYEADFRRIRDNPPRAGEARYPGPPPCKSKGAE